MYDTINWAIGCLQNCWYTTVWRFAKETRQPLKDQVSHYYSSWWLITIFGNGEQVLEILAPTYVFDFLNVCGWPYVIPNAGFVGSSSLPAGLFLWFQVSCVTRCTRRALVRIYKVILRMRGPQVIPLFAWAGFLNSWGWDVKSLSPCGGGLRLLTPQQENDSNLLSYLRNDNFFSCISCGEGKKAAGKGRCLVSSRELLCLHFDHLGETR